MRLENIFLALLCIVIVISQFLQYCNTSCQFVISHVLFRWLSSISFKYKPGYRSCDLLNIPVLSFKKNPLQDLLSSVNAVISTNERIEFITDHMTYNLAYT